MAYAVRWKINFVARNDDKYRLEILQDGWDGEIVSLRGAENPFETEEDNSDDVFYPIRKQVGTIRIRDNGFDLDGNPFDYSDMIPFSTLDNQVRLWKEGTGGAEDTLRWIGYMRPDSLTSQLFDSVTLREFPVSCPLATIYDMSVSFSNTASNRGTVKSMAQIIYTALSQTGIAWQNVYKQNVVQGLADLTAKVSLMNFVNDVEPTHSQSGGDVNAAWTDDKVQWGNVLEEICQFWGWVIYTRGTDIYIACRGSNRQYVSILFANMANDSISASSEIPESEMSLSDDLRYASTNHTSMRKQGYRNITIESDVNAISNVIEVPFRDISEYEFWPVAEYPGNTIHQKNNIQYALKRIKDSLFVSHIAKLYKGNYEIYESRTIQTMTTFAPFVTMVYDKWNNDAYTNKTDYNFTNGVCVYKGGQTSKINFRIKTLNDVFIPANSAISIIAATQETGDMFPDNMVPGQASGISKPNPLIIKATLKVGERYYDRYNDRWIIPAESDPLPIFDIPVRDNGDITDPLNVLPAPGVNESGILFNGYAGTKGFTIIISNTSLEGRPLCGRMELCIYSHQMTGSEQPTSFATYLIINDISVGVFTKDPKDFPQNEDKHEFKALASSLFKDDLNVGLNMASGIRNKYGLGQVFGADYNLLNEIPILRADSYVMQQPEQFLLDRMQRLYGSIMSFMTIDVMDDSQADNPSTLFENDDETYMLISSTHNWREGTMKLTLANI